MNEFKISVDIKITELNKKTIILNEMNRINKKLPNYKLGNKRLTFLNILLT